jgi:hypothetical protein
MAKSGKTSSAGAVSDLSRWASMLSVVLGSACRASVYKVLTGMPDLASDVM